MRPSIALAVVSVLCVASAARSDDARWFQQTHVVANWAIAPGSEDVVDVIGWGPHGELPEDAAWAKQVASAIHDKGGRVIGSVSTFDAYWNTLQARPDLLSAAVIDIDGKPAIVQWESTPEKPLVWENTNHPLWQQFLVEQMKRLVDAGVDGIIIDEIDGTSNALLPGSFSGSGSFGEPDMTLFRDYLARTYTAADLKSRFGITDIASFNYRDYIRGLGLVARWRSTPWSVPLYDDFYRFQRQAIVALMKDLTAKTRQYASEKYGRQITFSANTFGLLPIELDFADLLDYFTVEDPFVEVGYAPADRTIVDYKLARALGDKPAWTLISLVTVADLMKRRPVPNLLRLWVAESYASRGALMTPYKINGWSEATGPLSYEPDQTSVQPFYAFARANASLLDRRDTVPSVAVLYSIASHTNRGDRYRDSYRGAALALLQSHIQFDVAVLGNGPSVPSFPTLDRYARAILPAAASMTETQIDKLLAWVNGGGTLIVWGETATTDERGTPVQRPQLRDILLPGTHSHGEGRVIRLADDFGASYRKAQSEELRNQFRAFFDQGSIISSSAPANTAIEIDTAFSGSVVMFHLINGDYNIDDDSIHDSGPFAIEVPIPKSFQNETSLQAYLLSPERPEPARIDLSVAGGRIAFNAPSVHIYDLIAVMPEARAKSIAAGALSDLQSALNIAKAKGRDLTAIASLLAAVANATASGNHLLAENLARDATSQVQQINRPRVLFDEAHDERNTLSMARAQTIQPDHPEWVLVTHMIEVLSDEFAFQRNESTPLTPDLLSRFDVVFISAPRARFSSAELDALSAFVKKGGGLVAAGDCGLDATISALTLRYGISFSGCVFGPGGSLGNVFSENVVPHSATKRVTHFSMNWGETLAVFAPSMPLVRTNSDVWNETNFNNIKDPFEASGPFVIAAATDTGTGRVIALADNSFQNDGFDYWANEGPLRAFLQWVSDPGQRVFRRAAHH